MTLETDRYDLGVEVGQGGMATVYRARDRRLDRMVAVKVMHPHLRGASEARARFAREARAVARLKHPGIVEIHDYSGEGSEDAYIVTELLTGPTLRAFVEGCDDLPPEIAACMALSVAEALVGAHAEGIVHRDVKPENVLLHEARCLKLTDFGIADMLDAQSTGMTVTGQLLGSPAHMAPEQVEGGQADGRTDVYALGTVLYWLVTGQLPFEGQNPHQLLKRIVDTEAIDPERHRPGLGSELRAVIRRCMAKSPGARFVDMGSLVDALRAYLSGSGIDEPEHALADFLTEPASAAPALRAHLVAHLLGQARVALDQRQAAEVLDHLDRVLAMDEENPDALDLLDQAQRSRTRGRVLFSLAAGLCVCLIVSWLWLAGSSGDASAGMADEPTPAASVDQGGRARVSDAPTRPGTAPARSEPVAAGPAEAVAADASVGPTAAGAATKASGRSDRVASGRVEPIRTLRPPRPARTEHRVLFRPRPANILISVDGAELQPFGPAFRSVKLRPGRHSFRFVGGMDCCIEQTRELNLRPGPAETVLSPVLQMRPARLYVVANVMADVILDNGVANGRTRSVIQVPPGKRLRAEHTLRVTAPGYVPLTRKVQLQAGQLTSVDVALQRAPAAEPR